MSKFTIPKTQTAAVIPKIGGAIEIRKDHPVKQPEQLLPGECLVKIEATGCCHTDLHAAMGDWPVAPMVPLIGGHEGVGTIVAIANHTTNSPVKVGDRVGIKWLADSCLNCDDCREGREQNCANCKLSGYTVDGTFQEYCVSYVNHVTPIPEGFESDAAASVLCAGVTVYRAIKYSRTNPGNWIVIPGAGGGLGHLAVQYAQVSGLRVIAVDTGDAKKELVKSLGAEVWIDFKTSKSVTEDIKAATEGRGAHAAVVTAATGAGYQAAIEYLRPGGTLMCVGLPATATLDASIFFTVFKSISILGSYVGNRQDAKEALALAAAGKVKVHYATKPLSDLTSVYDDMHKGNLAGRIVFDLKA